MITKKEVGFKCDCIKVHQAFFLMNGETLQLLPTPEDVGIKTKLLRHWRKVYWII